MRTTNLTVAIGLLAMTFLVAGCVSSDGGEQQNAEPQASQVAVSEAETGIVVSGLVLTDESIPIAGATVALLPAEQQAVSAADGSFSFTGVEPGVYTLTAAKLGYESKAVSVTVEESMESYETTIQLPAIKVVDAYYSTTHYRGVHECTMSLVIWVSPCDYPYTAVYYTALGAGVNLSSYGLPAEPLENKWRWDTYVEPNSTESVSELLWEPTSAASNKMMIITSCNEYDPVIDDCDGWGHIEDGDAPYVRSEWDMPAGEDVFMTRVYLPWDGVQFAFDQKYDVWHTLFYGDDAPDEFSIVPDY